MFSISFTKWFITELKERFMCSHDDLRSPLLCPYKTGFIDPVSMP